MKKYYLLLVFTCLLMIPVCGQYNTSGFRLTSFPDKRCSLQNLTLTKDTTIALDINQLIYGLSISGTANLVDDKSFVRITLKDNRNYEYLVYENYTLLADNLIADFSEIGIETILLNGIIPYSLNIRVENAMIRLDELQCTTLASGNYLSRIHDIRSVQAFTMVDNMNRHLKERKKTWRAGITSISEMTYEEKKQLLGENVPYLGGFEHYKSGIFVMLGYKPEIEIRSSSYVKEFDWRKRHGKNWLTSAKKQSWNTCWSFASIGAVESYVNLYYNRLLDFDLSEQELISCIDPTYDPTKSGGFVSNALNYMKNKGVVEESCFPYKCIDKCINKCAVPDEIIKIGGYKSINPFIEDNLKASIIKAPCCFNLFFPVWGGHSVLLSGYKKIEEGDRILINMPSDQWLEIEAGNPLIGTTAWLMKNSLGTAWGDEGFGYVVSNGTSYLEAYEISGKVGSLNYTDSDIICEDIDEDGYYFWGIGTKPQSLPSWIPDESDGDDSNADIGPMDTYGNLKDLNPDLLSPQTINTSMLWNEDNYMHTHLVIDNGGKLVISGNISMYKDSKITVKNGGILIVDSGKVIRANIIVMSGGKLIVRNNGIIEMGNMGKLNAQLGSAVDVLEGTIR